jgi:hypothetical protein
VIEALPAGLPFIPEPAVKKAADDSRTAMIVFGFGALLMLLLGKGRESRRR